MSISLASSSTSSPHLSHLRPDAHSHRHMSIVRRLNLRTLNPTLRALSHSHSLRSPTPSRRRLAVSAAVREDTTVWTQAPITVLERAAESLFHVTIDASDAPDVVASHTRPGQYLQLRVPDVEKPSFLAIASPPELSASRGEFEFLVKSVGGSTAEILCKLGRGDLVELTHVMGKGFEVERIAPENFTTVLIFATGSGISPVRSLIESGFSADKRSDVRLYYGARNLQRMAYQDRFEAWEATGVKIVPVLSQPDDRWKGEHGYVQNAFARAQQKFNPLTTGVVLCGQKQMTEEVTDLLTANGVSAEKILKNF